jgi:hypothetical protein
MFNIQDQIEEIQTQIDESLDILDVSYKNISRVFDVPLGGDDPFVRRVIEEIKKSHDAILLVANKISMNEWSNSNE